MHVEHGFVVHLSVVVTFVVVVVVEVPVILGVAVHDVV